MNALAMRRWCARFGMVAVAGVLGVALAGAPASAHVEVKADKAQAGATDVTVTFVAESESTSVGIVSLRVVLPDGIAPPDVTYVSGPAGWTFTPAADGYTVAGPALPKKTDAEYAVKIAKLPAGATSLAFKTLQTYEGGRVDRWIEIPEPGQAEPDTPAPVLKLAPAAAPTAAPSSDAPASPSAAERSAPPGAVSPTPTAEDSSSSNGWVLVVVVLAALAVAAGVAVWLRRRGRTGTTDG